MICAVIASSPHVPTGAVRQPTVWLHILVMSQADLDERQGKAKLVAAQGSWLLQGLASADERPLAVLHKRRGD